MPAACWRQRRQPSLIEDLCVSGNVTAWPRAGAGGQQRIFLRPRRDRADSNSFCERQRLQRRINVATSAGLVGFNGPARRSRIPLPTGNVTAHRRRRAERPRLLGRAIPANSPMPAAWSDRMPARSPARPCPRPARICAAGQACASGAVSVGSNGTAGGLVGIQQRHHHQCIRDRERHRRGGHRRSTTLGGATTLGELVQPGLISNSLARGNVGGPNVANLQAGGLVGSNSGTIQSSVALGSVQAGDGSTAGGLVANPILRLHQLRGDGSQRVILNSRASGNVERRRGERRRRLRRNRRRHRSASARRAARSPAAATACSAGSSAR